MFKKTSGSAFGPVFFLPNKHHFRKPKNGLASLQGRFRDGFRIFASLQRRFRLLRRGGQRLVLLFAALLAALLVLQVDFRQVGVVVLRRLRQALLGLQLLHRVEVGDESAVVAVQLLARRLQLAHHHVALLLVNFVYAASFRQQAS